MREFRERAGLTTAQLAQRIGTSRQNIENLEAGNVGQPRYLPTLAKEMGLSVDALLTGRALHAAEPPAAYRTDTLDVPLMNVTASMGRGAAAADGEEVVSTMRINSSWLRRNATFTAPENLALLTAHGDSMRGTYEDGDVLLVDRGVHDVRTDAVYVLLLNDELYVKRLQRRPNGTLLMISDNQAYEPYPIEGEERERLSVLGRVVMAWNARRL